MEILNTQTEKVSNELVNDQKEFIATRHITIKQSIKDWGYEEAGLNQGDAFAFESHLRMIKSGHVVDESYDFDEELRRKKQLESEMNEKQSERNSKEKDQHHIKDVLLIDKENQLRKHGESIEQKRIQLAEGKIRSLYNPARFWLYVIVCTFVTLFLILFYASAINSAFFRNIQDVVNNSTSEDLSLSLTSPFDAKSIFVWKPQLLFIYFGAFVFFAFGIVPHRLHNGKKWQWIKIVAAILVCFVIDSLVAFKIDSSMHQLKLMVGINDSDWRWYASENFYLILVFGFGGYLVWGFLYEAAIKEQEKKNVNVIVEIEIKAIKKRIREVENEIIGLKLDVTELQKLVDGLKLSIESLKKELERALTKPETLLRNMENFYAGWLQYLTASDNYISKKVACETVYKNFHQSLADNIHLN